MYYHTPIFNKKMALKGKKQQHIPPLDLYDETEWFPFIFTESTSFSVLQTSSSNAAKSKNLQIYLKIVWKAMKGQIVFHRPQNQPVEWKHNKNIVGPK